MGEEGGGGWRGMTIALDNEDMSFLRYICVCFGKEDETWILLTFIR